MGACRRHVAEAWSTQPVDEADLTLDKVCLAVLIGESESDSSTVGGVAS